MNVLEHAELAENCNKYLLLDAKDDKQALILKHGLAHGFGASHNLNQ